MDKNNVHPPKESWQLKVFPIFTLVGWVLIIASFLIGLFVLSATATNYWGGSAKVVRDAAEAGSVLLSQLQVLSTIPRWLEPLTFLGVAAFMTGIALEFSSIPAILRNRGEVMSICFPYIVRLGSE